jgi:uncharacterized cysteine cluster protein YcgN (CxxCxxCC family)
MDEKTNDFWRNKSLDEMSFQEWEALCDGCGKCCLIPIFAEAEDIDPDDPDAPEPGTVYMTNVSCTLFDASTCRCASYDSRRSIVSACVQLTPEVVRSADWLPNTCAYRILARGEALPEWHPLITGDPQSTHRAGISMRGATVPEYEVAEEYRWDHVIDINSATTTQQTKA